MMFEHDPEIDRMVDEVYDVASALRRGDILTREQVHAIVREQPHQGRWDHVMHRVRKRMEGERGITLYVRPQDIEVGYALLTAKEQAMDLPRWREAKALRANRRTRKSAMAVPDKELSLNQRRLRNDQVRWLAQQAQISRRFIKQKLATQQPKAESPRRRWHTEENSAEMRPVLQLS